MTTLPTAVFAVFLASLSISVVSGRETVVSPTTGPGCQQDTPTGSGSFVGSASFDCISLSDALRTVSSNATLYLDPGTHHIDQFTRVYGLHDVSIIGAGGGGGRIEAVITCADTVGLAFVKITNLTIQNVRIEGCGLTGQNLTKTLDLLHGVVENFFEVPSEATIAVLLGHVENLTMQHTVVTNTSGLGLVGINVIGTSYISQVNFTFNIRPSNCTLFNNSIREPTTDPVAVGERIGGGAYFLYQDYSPAYQNVYHDQQYSLNIDRTNFIKNSECTFLVYVELSFRDSRALQEIGYTIGGAGGLGLMLAQLHYGVEITTTSAMIQNNTAVFGSGVHVGIFSGVRNSHVIFGNCKFIENGVSNDMLISPGMFSAGGGGLALINDLTRPEGMGNVASFHDRNLVVNISDSNFTENGVQAGGGAYILSAYTSPVRDNTDALGLNFVNCIFERNSALLGSALEVFEFKLNGRDIGMQLRLYNVMVIRNRVVPVNSDFSVSLSDNSAIIDIRNSNVTIYGNSTISYNVGTALHAEQSVVGIAGTTTFEKNTGIYGGAMRLIRNSYLIMTRGARLYLRENIGRVLGGALYIDFLGGQSAAFSFDDCFLYFSYDDFRICDDCSDLNSTEIYIEFLDNIAPFGSIVYGSALQNCPWAVPLHQRYNRMSTFDIIHQYYPNIINFNSRKLNGVDNVITAPRLLSVKDQQSTYFVAPGEEFNLAVSAIDGFIQNIPTVVSSYVISDQRLILQNITASVVGSNGFASLSGTDASTVPARIFGPENQTLTLVIFSTGLDSHNVQTQISLELGSCGSGFTYNDTTLRCECSVYLTSANIMCDITNHTLIVPNDLWIGPVTSGGDLAVSRCLNGYCQPGTRYVSVRNGSVNYDVQCDPDLNRVGILCGSCQDGYSIALGSDRCLQCSNSYVILFFVFALLGIFLIFSISYLRITITAGYLNGALFYANIVSLYGGILVPTSASGGRFVLASLLTLNLGIQTCLHDGLTSLERVWWQLSFPLYLFILMILTTLLVRYCKCFKFSRGAGLSTIQAFATLMIMCYVSVLQSCVELLGAVNISTENGDSLLRWVVNPTVPYFVNAHGFLAFIACVLIVIYIIPLPLFLLSPWLVNRIRYLNKFKPFYDVFWNPFEPQFRFWLGLRLIFRWVPFALIYFADSPDNTFVTLIFLAVLNFLQLTLRPFTGRRRNALDGYFLLNLIILFSGSVYFNAVAESHSGTTREKVLEQHTVFSTVFITFGYLGFVVVFIYHIFNRFPKLKNALHTIYKNRSGKKVQKIFVPQNFETGEEPQAELSRSAEYLTASKKHPPAVTVSELREPLLDLEGSIQIVSLPPVLTEQRNLTA